MCSALKSMSAFAMPRGNPNPRLNASAVSYKLQRYRTISDRKLRWRCSMTRSCPIPPHRTAPIVAYFPVSRCCLQSLAMTLSGAPAPPMTLSRENIWREMMAILFLDPLPSPRGPGTKPEPNRGRIPKQITQYVVSLQARVRRLALSKKMA